MDRSDAGLGGRVRGRQRNRAAVEADIALIGLVDAGEYLDQRRLARAVLADEGGDFAAMEFERHA